MDDVCTTYGLNVNKSSYLFIVYLKLQNQSLRYDMWYLCSIVIFAITNLQTNNLIPVKII